MLAAIKTEITKYLDAATQLCMEKRPAPHHYTSLKETIILLELKREVAVLRNLLESEDFAAEFKNRCTWRTANTELNLNCQHLPDSSTNILYWNIANLVFKPKTMADMLSILLPQVTTQLTVTLPDDAITITRERSELSQQLHNARPVLKKMTLSKSLTSPAVIDDLRHYIVIGNELFDLEDISHFTLPLHLFFQDYVATVFPELAKKIYQFSTQLQILATSIVTYKHKGVAPSTAIEQLIKHLILGGNNVTNQEYASLSSTQSLQHFFGYFNSLPAPLQKKLRSLSVVHHLNREVQTFGDLIDVDIEKGLCTETTASVLRRMLEHHKNEPALNLPPQMSRDDVKRIAMQYSHKKPLDVYRDEFALITFPMQLLNVALQGIATNNHEELVMLIVNFPPQLYELLWEHLAIKQLQLERLSQTIAANFFSRDQLMALAKAIAKQKARLNRMSLLEWAIATGELIFVQEVMNTYEDKVAALKTPFNGSLPLHYHPSTPAISHYLLTLVPAEQRAELLISLSDKSMNVLQSHVSSPELLTTLLNLVPSKQRVAVITAFNGSGNNLLHLSANKLESIRAILGCLEPEQQLLAIKVKTSSQDSVLHRAKENTNSFAIILDVYPTSQEKSAAIMALDSNQFTVLHALTQNPKSLTIALGCIPQHQQFDAIKTQDIYGESVLHKAARLSTDSLQILLKAIPKERLLDLLPMKTKHNASLLQYICARLETVCLIVEHLPERQRHLVFEKDPYFIASIKNAAIIGKILKLLPEEDRLKMILNNLEELRKLFSFALTNPEALSILLEAIPRSHRFSLVMSLNGKNLTLLHEIYYPNQVQQLKTILDSLAVDEQLEAVLARNQAGRTLLSNRYFDFDFGHCILLCLGVPQRLLALIRVDAKKQSMFELFADHESFPDRLKIILALLQQEVKDKSFKEQLLHFLTLAPETERLRLLKIKTAGKTILAILAGSNLAAAADHSNDSFLPTFMKIYNLVQAHAQAPAGTMSFFRVSKSAKAILDLLDYSETFTSFKTNLLHHFAVNQTAALTEQLLRLLVPGATEVPVMLDKLAHLWHAQPPNALTLNVGSP